MSGHVVVRLLTDVPAPHAGTVPGTMPVLRLSMGPAGGGGDVVAEAGPVRWGSAAGRYLPDPTADEHFAVDADTCAERRRLDWADVLYGRLPRPPAAAARWLAEVTARHPACALAAVPVTDGGWMAVAGAAGRGTPTVLAGTVPPDQPLLASCLHAWLVRGHALADLAYVRPAGAPLTAASPPAPDGGRRRGW
ncbi:hypothetical protein [Streptomyces cinerochromogenes]|uniref:hypothetical protein n=1 Tax=Streptomyces cinerochromogenes TaxID=66422 RepID=UPI00166FDCE3|nr:hypothetical protein [Streptomyces cinerochromogenes]GGS83332.1 hypothetical protein GCM10010206_52410 [Streptomyces cinerochromogenes]